MIYDEDETDKKDDALTLQIEDDDPQVTDADVVDETPPKTGADDDLFINGIVDVENVDNEKDSVDEPEDSEGGKQLPVQYQQPDQSKELKTISSNLMVQDGEGDDDNVRIKGSYG